MPRSSKDQLIELALLMGFDSELNPDFAIVNYDEILPFVQLILSKRYLSERSEVPKSLQWSEMAFLNMDYDDNRFRGQFRMNRDSFFKLINLISNNQVFNQTQDPIQLQVGVALFRFGTYGNAAGIRHVATKFGISEGSVVNFTKRVIISILELSNSYIFWPCKNERIKIGSEMATRGLPKCIGFVDGTDIVLSNAPKENKEVYWSRKKKYCVQAQIICDPQKQIRDLYVGYPGSVHDAKVFISSPIGAQPNQYFSEGEFIVGDSAYSLTETVIVPFRKPQGGLPQDKKSFNYRLSEHRVVVENTIGLLKARFQSLKGLRLQITEDNDGHKKVCQWTQTCAILHNMLNEHDPWEEDDNIEDETDEECHLPVNTAEVNSNANKSGQLKRLALLQIHKAI